MKSPVLFRRALTGFVALGLMAIAIPSGRTAIVRFEAGGTITGGDAFPALTGQTWSLILVYDTDAVADEFANDPGMGNYPATSTTTPIISYKIQYGGFVAEAQSPMDADPDAIRLTVLNLSSTKYFHFEMHSASLLPVWNGKKPSSLSFMFGLDSAAANWSDDLPTNDEWVKDINFSPFVTQGDLFFPDTNGGPLQDVRAMVSSVEVTNLSTVPEPTSVGLIGIGAIVIGILKRRMNQSKAPVSSPDLSFAGRSPSLPSSKLPRLPMIESCRFS